MSGLSRLVTLMYVVPGEAAYFIPSCDPHTLHARAVSHVLNREGMGTVNLGNADLSMGMEGLLAVCLLTRRRVSWLWVKNGTH